MTPAMTAISDALEFVAKEKHPAFSWRPLITGHAPEALELRRFREHSAGPQLRRFAARGAGRQRLSAPRSPKLGFDPGPGCPGAPHGSVPLSDEEFATVADGAALNGVVTILVVLLLLWLALKQARIIFAVLINLAVGLTFTAALGLLMVGALNLISVAFAVLSSGGVDFGIQFSVRYRAERHATGDPAGASGYRAAGRGAAPPRRRIDRGRLLLFLADRLCRPFGLGPIAAPA